VSARPGGSESLATVQVRYIVRDVDAAIAFSCRLLGFQAVMHPVPAFAMLSRGDLRLVLSAPNPASGGGQASRISATEDAWAHRDTSFIVNMHGRWETPSEDGALIAWARKVFDALAPHATGSVYVNFMTADEKARVPSAYGASFKRLAEIKKRFDPGNLFRMNHNIAPA
jgi:catechol 2,3-dioxygenase-like lactoylglutathione lyase family enzyme